jgi:hypothetical protein
MSDFDIKIELVDETKPAGSPGESLKNSALMGDLGTELQSSVLKQEIERLSRLQSAQAIQDLRSQSFADRQAAIRETLELRIATRREQSEIKLADLSESLALRTSDRVARAQELASIRNIQREDRASDEMAKKIGRSVVALNPGGLFKSLFTGFSESIGRSAFNQFRQVTKDRSIDPGKYVGNVVGGLYNRASEPVARVLGYNSAKEMTAKNSGDPLKGLDSIISKTGKAHQSALDLTAESGKRGKEFLELYFQNLKKTVLTEINNAKDEIQTPAIKRVTQSALYLSGPYLQYRRALGLAVAKEKAKLIEVEFNESELETINRVPTGGTLVVGNPGYTAQHKLAENTIGVNLRQSLNTEYLPLQRDSQNEFFKSGKLPESFNQALKDPDVFHISKQALNGVLTAKDINGSDEKIQEFKKRLGEAKSPENSDDLFNLFSDVLSTQQNEQVRQKVLSVVERLFVGSNVDLPEQIAQIKKIQDMREDINVQYLGYCGGSGHVRDIKATTGVSGVAMAPVFNEERNHPVIIGGQDYVTKGLGDTEGYLPSSKRIADAGKGHDVIEYFNNPEVIRELANALGIDNKTASPINEESANINTAVILLQRDLLRYSTKLNDPKKQNKTTEKIIKEARESIVNDEPNPETQSPVEHIIKGLRYSVDDLSDGAVQNLQKKIDEHVQNIASISDELPQVDKLEAVAKEIDALVNATDRYIKKSHLASEKVIKTSNQSDSGSNNSTEFDFAPELLELVRHFDDQFLIKINNVLTKQKSPNIGSITDLEMEHFDQLDIGLDSADIASLNQALDVIRNAFSASMGVAAETSQHNEPITAESELSRAFDGSTVEVESFTQKFADTAKLVISSERKLAHAFLELENTMTFGLASKYRSYIGTQAKQTAQLTGSYATAYFRQNIQPDVKDTIRLGYGVAQGFENALLTGTGTRWIKSLIQSTALPVLGGVAANAALPGSVGAAFHLAGSASSMGAGMLGAAVQPLLQHAPWAVQGMAGAAGWLGTQAAPYLGMGAAGLYAGNRLNAAAGGLAQNLGNRITGGGDRPQLEGRTQLRLPFVTPIQIKAELVSSTPELTALPDAGGGGTIRLNAAKPQKALPSGATAEQGRVIELLTKNVTDDKDAILSYVDGLNKKQLDKIASRLGIGYANRIGKSELTEQLKNFDFRKLTLAVSAQKEGTTLPSDLLKDFKIYTKQIKSGLGTGSSSAQGLADILKEQKIRYDLTKPQNTAINNLIKELERVAKNNQPPSGLAGYEIEDSSAYRSQLERAKKLVSKQSNTNINRVPIEIDPSLGSAGMLLPNGGSPIVKIKSDTTSSEVLLHELRHAAQILNPALKLMTPKDVSPDEFNRVKGGIANSVQDYMKRNPKAEYKELDRVHSLETDAYLFAQKFRKELETSINKQSRNGLSAHEISDKDLAESYKVAIRPVEKSQSADSQKYQEKLERLFNKTINDKIETGESRYIKAKKSAKPESSVQENPDKNNDILVYFNKIKVKVQNGIRGLDSNLTTELDLLKKNYLKFGNETPGLKKKSENFIDSVSDKKNLPSSTLGKVRELNNEYAQFEAGKELSDNITSNSLTNAEIAATKLQAKLKPVIDQFEKLTGVSFDGNIGKFIKDIAGVSLERASLFVLPLLLSNIAIGSRDAALEFDRFKVQVNGLGEGNAEIEKLNASILKTGVNINASREAYLGFKSGLIGTNNESQFDQIFENLQVTLKNRVPDPEKQKLVIQGLVQATSKGGALQSEEFRGQISESLRGSLQLAQAATGYDATTFSRKLKKQEIQTETFIPAFLAAGRGGSQTEGNSTLEKLERYNSQTQLLSESLGIVPLETFAFAADLASKAIGVLNQNSIILGLITGTVLIRSLIGVSGMLLNVMAQFAGTTVTELGMIGTTKLLGSTLQTVGGFALNFAKSLIIPALIAASVYTLVDAFDALGATQGQIGELVDRMKQLNDERIRGEVIKTEKPSNDAPGSDLDGVETKHFVNNISNSLQRANNAINRFFGLDERIEENQGTRREVTEGATQSDEGIKVTRQNFDATAKGLNATSTEDLAQFNEYTKKEQVLKTKISIAASDGDVSTVVKLNEELAKLQKDKSPVVDKIFGNQGKLTEQANAVRSLIKDLESQIEKDPQKKPYYEKQLAGLKTLIAEMDNEIKNIGTKLNPEIIALSKFKSGIESLDAQFTQKTQEIAISKSKATVVADARGGTNAQSQTAVTNAGVDIATIQKEVNQLQNYRKQVLKKVVDLDPNTKAVLETALGKSLAKAGTEDIDRVLADVEKYNISKPQEIILQSLKKINENSVTVAQKELELSTAQQAYIKAQIDLTNQLADYYRNKERAITDEALAVNRFNRGFAQQTTDALLQAQTLNIGNTAQEWKNKFSKAIIGSTDSLVTSLSNTLSGIISDTQSILEGKVAGQKLYTDLSRTITNAKESVYDQNLSNSRSAEDRSIQDRDMFGQKNRLYNPSLTTSGIGERDLANLALTTLQESSGLQNQLDVAVSMFNRLAKGTYGSSLTDLLYKGNQSIKTVQYAPNLHKTPVNSIDEAAARLGGGSAKAEIMQLLNALKDPGAIRTSQMFIQGATDFKGTSELPNRHAEDPYRGTSGANFFHEVNGPQFQNDAIRLIEKTMKGVSEAPVNRKSAEYLKVEIVKNSDVSKLPVPFAPPIGSAGSENSTLPPVPKAVLDPKYVGALEAQTKAQYAQTQLQARIAEINKQSNQAAYVRSAKDEIFRTKQEIQTRRRDIGDRISSNSGYADNDLKTFRDTAFAKNDQIAQLQLKKDNLDKIDIPALQNLLAEVQALNESVPGSVSDDVLKTASASLAARVDESRALEESITNLGNIDGEIPLLMALERRVLSINSELVSARGQLMDMQRLSVFTEGERSFFDSAKQIVDVREKFSQNKLELPIQIRDKENELSTKQSILNNSPDLSAAAKLGYELEIQGIKDVLAAKKELLEWNLNNENQANAELAISAEFTRKNRDQANSITNSILSQRQEQLAKKDYSFKGADYRNVAEQSSIINDTEQQLENLNQMRVVLQSAGVDTNKLRDDIIALGELRLINLVSSADELGMKLADGISSALVTGVTDLAELLVDPSKSVVDVFKGIASNILGVFKSVFADIAKEMLSMSLKKGLGSLFSGLLGSLGSAPGTQNGGSGLSGGVGLLGSVFSGLFGGGGGAGIPSFGFSPIAGFAQGGVVKNYAEGGLVGSIQSAMQAEGIGAVLTVQHVGERNLSAKTGDAQKFDALVRSGIWDNFKVSNYASGGVVSGSTPMLSGGGGNKIMQATYVSNITIKANDPDTFRASESQIRSEQDRKNRIASQKSHPY